MLIPYFSYKFGLQKYRIFLFDQLFLRMNYFPGCPIKRPKPKEVDSSGTEATQKSSMQYGSGVTPTFHNVSDDQFFDTPRMQKKKRDQHSTQDFMQQLVNQNQNSVSNNGLFGSLFSFGGRDERQAGNNLFGTLSGNNQFDEFQFSFASDDYSSFNGSTKLRNQSFFDIHYTNQQLGDKRSILNPMKKQSRIQEFEKTNEMTIFEVKEEFEGLTNPMEVSSQQNSQALSKTNFQPQNYLFQSDKKRPVDNHYLRQSIIEVLSSMDSSESASKKQLNPDLSLAFGINGKGQCQEEKDTIIDDLSDLVLSPPKHQNQIENEKILVVRPLARSQRKQEFQAQLSQAVHGNSTKTQFQLRNKNKSSLQNIEIKPSQPLNQNPKRLSIFKQCQVYGNPNDEKKVGKNNNVTLSDRQSSQFMESKVAQINLESLHSLVSQKNLKSDSRKITKTGNSTSFFKNKPFDLLNQRNERKNNFMTNLTPKQSNKIPQNNQKSSRKQIFSRFNSNRFIKSKEKQLIGQYSSNPLPIDDDQNVLHQSYPTKPFEYHSQAIDLFSQFDTKPVSFKKAESLVSKFGMFGKRNRNFEPKKSENQVKFEIKLNKNQKNNPNESIRNKLEETNRQSELIRKQNIITETHQNEDNTSLKSNKFNFIRSNPERIIQVPKVQIKKEQILPRNSDLQNKIDGPRKIGVFKFQRRKNHVSSKVSKNSFSSINSSTSENGLDMKGILQKVNQKKQHTRKNIIKNNQNQNKKLKHAFSFKYKNNFQAFRSSNVEEEKINLTLTEKQSKQIQIDINPSKRPKFGQSKKNQQHSNHEDYSLRKIDIKEGNNFGRTLTVEKQKLRINSTIPKYIFSKKTPPKNPMKSDEKFQKKDEQMFESIKKSEVDLESGKKSLNMFESRKRQNINRFPRSNYMIQREKQGFKEETESQKMRYRNRRSESSGFPSLSSNSTRSELIREVENMIELVAIAKQRMRKKKDESEEFLQKTIEWKKRIDEMFPPERIKNLMNWKYL